MQRIRFIEPGDATALADIVTRDRQHLAPWDPERPEEFFTEAGQRAVIDAALLAQERGDGVFFVILDDEGRVAGRVTLTSIVRAHLLSCVLGYFLSAEHTGRGYATQAAAAASSYAFTELGLHRVEAGTMVENTASQKVLTRVGFTQFGLAPAYLKIGGVWRDHLLFQKLADEGPGAHPPSTTSTRDAAAQR